MWQKVRRRCVRIGDDAIGKPGKGFQALGVTLNPGWRGVFRVRQRDKVMDQRDEFYPLALQGSNVPRFIGLQMRD